MPLSLPITPFKRDIVSAVDAKGRAVLCAPPGSGKSTQVPQFFLPRTDKDIIVLQPRRLAARSLAAFVAQTRGEEPGGTIGYRVRHESRTGRETRIIYETYGVFIRRALSGPIFQKTGLVILDEFHERSLEMDLALAFLRHSRAASSEAPPFILMSASLEPGPLLPYLELDSAISVDVPVHPVRVDYQRPEGGESSPRQAARALKTLLSQGFEGSVLIFMPGIGEIRSTVSLAEEVCTPLSIPVFALHGSLPLAEQGRVISAPSRAQSVIVSTNVAETSLTIPGVRAVIDSGYERRAAFDPVRDRNTLYRLLISKSSAIQRCGRAGREGPGRCVRLYAEEAYNGLNASLPPEMTRLDLTDTLLKAQGLVHEDIHSLQWPTEPDSSRFNHALSVLEGLGAIARKNGKTALTPKGRALLRWPLDPVSSALLEEAREAGVAQTMCAVLALWEHEQPSQALDLFDEAKDFIGNPGHRRFDIETRKTYEELVRTSEKDSDASLPAKEARKALAACFMRLLKGRLAVREPGAARFLFEDGSGATLAGRKKETDLPSALIALEILQTAGAFQAKNNSITAFVGVEIEWIAEVLKDRCQSRVVCGWDAKRKSVTAEQCLLFGPLVLSRNSLPPEKADPKGAAEVMADKCLSGEIALKDDSVKQLLNRIALLGKCYPEKNIKPLDDDDWKLIYGELCLGKRNATELEPAMLAGEITRYYGHSFGGMLDKLAPERMILPSGKKAKVFYPDNGPAELSARITDFLGMKGRFTLCQGRAQGIFDILAPNYRTVQKTEDLGSFWQNIYPEIKNQLKRKYPRHPWP